MARRLVTRMTPEREEQHKKNIEKATLKQWELAKLLQASAFDRKFPVLDVAPIYLSQAIWLTENGFSVDKR